MEISKKDFLSISEKLKIPKEQSEELWASLEKGSSKSSALSKLIYYFGALIVICAMSWFMTLGWEWFGGGGLFFISLAYAALFLCIGALLWKKEDLRIPAGLLVTMAVCMVPLAIYGLEEYWKIWPSENPGNYQDFYTRIKGSWIFMEIGTIVAGLIALYFFPFPFITAPIFFAAWFLAMDICPLLFGENYTWQQQSWISLFFGLGLMVIGFLTDREKKPEYGFWSYLFGTISFWGALTSLVWDKHEFILFLYCLFCIFMMFLSIILRRKILMICGALGAFAYLSHLSYEIFKDSILFPFILSFIGLAVIFFGVLYQKNIDWIEAKANAIIPESVRRYLNL